MIEVNPEFYHSPNILTLDELANKAEQFRKIGKVVGVCTGSFDLLHPGHVTHINSAKRLCDVLMVGVANDKFSSRKAPTGRPIFSYIVRAYMVSQLKAVDFVFIEDGTPKSLELIKPRYFIKGPDYQGSTNPLMVEQARMMSAWGGERLCTQDEKLSTTEILDYIRTKT